jgi:hypothetical protein
MFRIWFRLWPLVVLAWFSCATQGFSQQEFRWKFREGETRDMEMTQEIVHEMNEKRTETSQTMWLRWHIKKVDENGTANVEQSVRRLKMSVDNKPVIDTDNPEPQEDDSPIAARLRALMRVRFTAETTSRGEIIGVQFEPEVLDRLRDQLGLDEKTVQQTFAQETILFPIRPLDVGATWSSTTQSPIEGLGEISTTTTYQYVGDEKIEGVTLSKFKITPAFQINESSRALAKQEGDSTLWFDRERGLMVRGISSQVFEIKKKEQTGESVQKNSVKTTIQFSDPK